MSTANPANGDKPVKSTGATATRKDPKGPPDERFWERYSPHHEAPLSGVGSLLLHVLGIVAIVLIALGVARLDKGNRRIDISGVARAGGGGGSGNAVGPGAGTAETPAEDPGTQPMPMTPMPMVEPRDPVDIETAKTKEPETQPDIRPISSAEAKKALAQLDSSVRKKLMNFGNAGAGGGVGPGSDGGKDGGKGLGEGPGVGSGSGKISQREQRMMRWTMNFSTRSGGDYLQQLSGLGAFLAIPTPGTNPPEYKLIRDLTARPPRLLEEDLSQIKRVFWVDNKADSVRSISTALGLNMQIDHFVAFMPPDLEQKLVRLERAYRDRQEDQIDETIFGIRRSSTGFEPFVISQTARR